MRSELSIALIASLALVSAIPTTKDSQLVLFADDTYHPKTSFLNVVNDKVLYDGLACDPATNKSISNPSLLHGHFQQVPNVFKYNTANSTANELRMGYVVLSNGKCLKHQDSKLTIASCPSFSETIQIGNKFAFFYDVRNEATFAYGGDAKASPEKGQLFNVDNLASVNKHQVTFDPPGYNADLSKRGFLGYDVARLGDASHAPKGCA